jgi:DNA topoisomerase-1
MALQFWLGAQFGGAATGKKKWETFQHNGVMFPPEYVQHNTPVIYKGQQIYLEPIEEEYATLYAKYLKTEHANNKTFNKNFWNDWRIVLGKTHKIQSLEDCDFSLIVNYLELLKEAKKALTDEEKQKIIDSEKKYKTALVDGKEQPVGNYKIEPPGIFIGRGSNPKLGKIKRRVYPEDIIINIGKESPVPEPLHGHKWEDVIHDKTVEWLASWKDDITGKIKYVWLGAQSNFKSQSDINKFDLARKLKKKIKTIREENEKNLSSDDTSLKQIATALYFIDNLALRVGNEKDLSEEADTVGVTSLRVEHIKLLPKNTVTLDFLGKDSIRYIRTMEVAPQVYKNLQEFTDAKDKNDDLFTVINANDLNKYLQSFMKGLTAKVFRTYNASDLFQKELTKITRKYETYTGTDKVEILIDEFNKANVKVALLCNHQKNVSKSYTEQVEKLNNMIKNLKSRSKKAKKDEMRKKIKEKINKIKAKKDMKSQMKNVSLGTSKINYIDPRITIAFMKKHDLHADKVFSKTLQEKFKWAFEVTDEYRF